MKKASPAGHPEEGLRITIHLQKSQQSVAIESAFKRGSDCPAARDRPCAWHCRGSAERQNGHWARSRQLCQIERLVGVSVRRADIGKRLPVAAILPTGQERHGG